VVIIPEVSREASSLFKWGCPWEKGTRENNSLAIIGQGIQRVSQFELSLFFAAQELDFFQEKHIAGSAELVLEFIDRWFLRQRSFRSQNLQR